MTIMTMISTFDRPRLHRGLASAFSSEKSTISMYSIFTCAINAEILWRATSEGSFGVVAYEAAVTVVFSCYTLVYVCKTEVHATIQFAFNSELSFSPTKGILRNYEAVFISKILFTVQIQLCLVIQLCPFVIQLSSCHSIISVCLSIMSSCHSVTIFHHACLTFSYVRYYLLITASSRLSCTRFENGVEGNLRCERFRAKRRKLSTSINIVEWSGGYPEVTMHVERSSATASNASMCRFSSSSGHFWKGRNTRNGASFSVLQSGRIYR